MTISQKSDYYKNRYRTFVLRLIRGDDEEIIKHLEKHVQQGDLTAYIKMLVWVDMNGGD